MTNKNGKLSGGEIFDFLDKGAVEIAKKMIGDCVTISANIEYLGVIQDLYNSEYTSVKINTSNPKVVVTTNTEDKVFGTFIFVKSKNDKSRNDTKNELY